MKACIVCVQFLRVIPFRDSTECLKIDHLVQILNSHLIPYNGLPLIDFHLTYQTDFPLADC